MDLATLFQAPIVERIGGLDISFPRVPSRDLATIAAKLKGKWRAADVANADEQKLNQTQRFRVIQEADRREVTTGELVGYIDTPQGGEDVIRLSLKRAKMETGDVDTIIDAMDAISIANLALRLTGVSEIPVTTDTKKPGETPKATDGGPLAFGTQPAEGAVIASEAKGFQVNSTPEEPPAGAPVTSTGSPPQPNLNSTSDAT